MSPICAQNCLSFSATPFPIQGRSVLLSQEIDNARHYLYIMKIRYEDDLKYEWQLDDSLNDITVPKLILQPLMRIAFSMVFIRPARKSFPHGKYRSVLTTTKTDGIFPLPITERLSRKKSFPIYAARLPALLLPEIRIWITSPFSDIKDMVWKIPFSAFISTITVKIISCLRSMKNEQTTVTIGGPLKPEKSFSRNSL